MTDVATLLSISNTMSAAETRLPQPGGEARSSPQPHDASASPAAAQDAPDGDSIMLLEPRPFRPFKTSEEYLYAMREDLAEWLKNLYQLDINVDNFFEILETGEVLCGVSLASLLLGIFVYKECLPKKLCGRPAAGMFSCIIVHKDIIKKSFCSGRSVVCDVLHCCAYNVLK